MTNASGKANEGTIKGTIGAAIEAGDLGAAVAAALAAVKARPADQGARLLLIDLMIVAGEHERADRQADILANLAPDMALGVSLLRGRLRAADARAAWFATGAVPSFPDGPTARDEAAMRLGVAAHASEGVAEALEALTAMSETGGVLIDGSEPASFRDADDGVPHALELLGGNGSYVWVDWARVVSLRFEPVRAVRDLVWRPAQLETVEGAASEIVVCTTYHCTDATDAERLGRETNWDERGGVTRGRGQKLFLHGDETALALDVTSIERG